MEMELKSHWYILCSMSLRSTPSGIDAHTYGFRCGEHLPLHHAYINRIPLFSTHFCPLQTDCAYFRLAQTLRFLMPVELPFSSPCMCINLCMTFSFSCGFSGEIYKSIDWVKLSEPVEGLLNAWNSVKWERDGVRSQHWLVFDKCRGLDVIAILCKRAYRVVMVA